MTERQQSNYQRMDEYDKYKDSDWKFRIFRPGKEWSKPLKLLWTYKIVLMNLAASLYLAEKTTMYGEKMIPWYITAATLYIVGRVADNITAIELSKTIGNADEIKVKHHIIEINPHLPSNPTSQNFLSRNKLGLDIGHMIPGIILPPVGIFWGITGGAIAYFTTRTNENLKRKL